MDTSPNSGSANERLISDLATDLVPVRRLEPPGVRALTWLAVVIATAAGLAAFADLFGTRTSSRRRQICGYR